MADWVLTVGLAVLDVVLTLFLTAVAAIGARKPPRRDSETGELVLEYGLGPKILTIVLGAFPLPIVLGAILTDFNAFQAEARTWLILVGFFFFFSLPFSIEFFGVAHRMTQQGIRKGSPWSRKFFARWEDISSVTYSMASEGYVVKTPRGKIRLSAYLRGINEFRARMAQRELQTLESMLAAGTIPRGAYLKRKDEIGRLYGVPSD